MDLEIIAADSAAAILDSNFDPLQIVAVAAVLVKPPYREASTSLAEPIFVEASEGHKLIVHELELCKSLLKKVGGNVVHLDMSLGSLPVEALSPIQLSNMRISRKARGHVLKILPQMRKLATELKRVYDVDVLAIGKDSVPVRIAELTAGAHAILYSAEKLLQENKKTLSLGLPIKCVPQFAERTVTLQSLAPAEHDVLGYAKDSKEVLKKVKIVEMPNPYARGFRVLKIYRKQE